MISEKTVNVATEKTLAELLRGLSGFIRDKATQNGLSINAFCLKYGLNNTTLSNYINGKKFPDSRALLEVAQALKAETGEPITLSLLQDLIDPPDEPYQGDFEKYKNAGAGQNLLRQFDLLPLDAQLKIIPELQRQFARTIELAAAPRGNALAILLREEMVRRGVGVSAFARAIAVDEKLVGRAVKSLPIDDYPLSELRQLAREVRDENGNYGNLARFFPMVGIVHIRLLVEKFMDEKSIDSVAELVDYLLIVSEVTVGSRSRLNLIKSVEKMLETERLISQNDPAFEQIIPVLGKELGFNSVTDFVSFLQKDCSC